MALSTYSELQQSIADWLNRSDLSARIPDFIALAEAQIRGDVRSLSVRDALVIDGEEVTLPADVGELRSLVLKGALGSQNAPVAVVTPEMLADQRRIHMGAGQPRYVSVIDSVAQFVPTPDADYDAQIVYYQELPPLATNTTNDVLTTAPDIYLYGSLLEAAAFLEHDERIAGWQARYDRAVARLNTHRERQEYGASLRPVRLPVVF